MAFELGKLNKFAPFVAIYAFYNVFATNYPTDPFTGMKTALTNFFANPIVTLQAKTQQLTTLAIIIIGVPIALRAVHLPTSVKMIVNLIVYYIIGDQLASLINGPGRFGSIGGVSRPLSNWGGQTSAFHQTAPSAGVVKNIYGG